MSFAFFAKWNSFNNWSRIIDFGISSENSNIIVANEGATRNFIWEVWSGGRRRMALNDGIV